LLVVTATIYWPGLAGPLVLDDVANLEPLTAIGSDALDWREVLGESGHGIGRRPIAVLSFIANWLTSGGEVWSLKYTNLLIHLLCGTLLFWLSGRLLGEPLAGVAARRWWLALLVAALWLLTPMLVSTVLYVVQRMAQLATLFVLAGLTCYVIGRQRLTKHRPSGIGLMLLCFLVFWPLATLSKQNGALLPLLAAAVEFGFFSRPRSPGDRRLVNGLLAFVVGVPALCAAVVLAVDPDVLGGAYQARDFTTYERVLSEARILWDYAANLLMLPGGSPFGLFHDDVRVSRGLVEPPTTLVAIAGWIALLVLAWLARGGAWSAIVFGPVFFLAAHLLESTVFPLELYFEHRNYLPSVGLFLSLGVVAGRLIQRTRFTRTFIMMVTLVPLAHGVMTMARVINWQSMDSLLLISARNHPNSPRVHTGLAGMYLGRNDIDKAFEHLDRAGALYEDRQSYAIALHRINGYCVSGRPVAERHYRELSAQTGISDTVYTANALRALVENAEQGACAGVDLPRIADKIHRDVSATSGPGDSDRNWSLRVYTARLLALLGRTREAAEHALIAVELEPTWLEPGLLALEYQLQLGDKEGARRTLAELKRRDKGRVALYTRLIGDYARQLE
jgi:tetratricopeptide (TPR) repeat protein